MPLTRIASARWLVALLAAVALAGGCSAAGLVPNTDFEVGDSIGEWNSFPPGEIVWAGTDGLTVTASRPVELRSLEPLGLPASIERTGLYMPTTEGTLGLFPEREVPAANRALVRPLEGVVAEPGSTFQALIRFAVPDSDVVISGFVLHYRIGGLDRQVYIPHSAHICRDQASCGPVDPHP